MKRKNIFKTVIPILMPLAMFSSPTAETEYSEWSEVDESGTYGSTQQSKTQYRSRDVATWSSCGASDTTHGTFYRQGTYDPMNCCVGYRCTGYSCTGYSAEYSVGYTDNYGWWCYRWAFSYYCSSYGSTTSYYCTGYGTTTSYSCSGYSSYTSSSCSAYGYYSRSYCTRYSSSTYTYCSSSSSSTSYYCASSAASTSYYCRGYSGGYDYTSCDATGYAVWSTDTYYYISGYSCDGYSCSSTECSQLGSCGQTGTCYQSPATWGSYSAWQDTTITQTSSKQVETRTVYRHPLNCTITLNGNSGTVTPSSSFVVSFNGTIDPSGYTATKLGYTFDGWYTAASGGSKYTTGTCAGTNLTLYAHWTANTYTVNYNGNGNTGGSTSASTHTYDAAKALTANGFTRAYTVTFNHNYSGSSNSTATATYSFAGWATSTDGSVAYSDKQSVSNLASTKGATVQLYAKWNSASVTLTNPSRTGYTFGGWYGETGLSTLIGNAGANYTPTANKTLYAKWTPITYSITYNLNGGTNSGSNPSTYNIETSTITLANPTRKGYTFGGWFSDASFNTPVTSIAKGSTGNKTLYAKWTANEHNVTLNSQGATSDGKTSVRATYDSAMPVITVLPVKTGYTFGGYYAQPNCAGTKYIKADGFSNANFDIDSDTTMYACWLANEITFNGGTKKFVNDGESDEFNISVAKNGTGNYSYQIISQKDENGSNVNYASLSGRKITFSENAPDGSYTIVVRAKDNVTGLYKDANYVVVTDKKVYWGIDNDGTLTISNIEGSNDIGNGLSGQWKYTGSTDGVYNFVDTSAGWGIKPQEIKKVSITAKIYPKSLAYWFYNMNNLTQIEGLSYIDSSRLTSTAGMFKGCSSLASIDLSAINTSKVTNMSQMFDGCSNLTTLKLGSNFTTANVDTIYAMFRNCSKLTTLDLSAFDTRAVNNEQGFFEMFGGDSSLKTIYASPNFVTGSNFTSRMFNGCTSIVGGGNTRYDPENTDWKYARIGSELNPGYFTSK